MQIFPFHTLVLFGSSRNASEREALRDDLDYSYLGILLFSEIVIFMINWK